MRISHFTIFFSLFLVALAFDGGIYVVPCILFTTVFLFRMLTVYSVLLSILVISLGLVFFLSQGEILYIKSALIIHQTFVVTFATQRQLRTLIGRRELMLLMIILIIITIASIPIVDNYGIFGIPRMAPFGIDPNNFGWSIFLMSVVYGIGKKEFLLVFLGQSASIVFSMLFLNSAKKLTLIFIFVMALYLALYFQAINLDDFRFSSWGYERLISLQHRAFRTFSAFSDNYAYEGLNPHTSVAAGYLKIGLSAIFIALVLIIATFFRSMLLGLSWLFASIFVDVWFGTIVALLPWSILIARKNESEVQNVI